MKAWTPWQTARFAAVDEYYNLRLRNERSGIGNSHLLEPREFVLLMNSSGSTFDPYRYMAEMQKMAKPPGLTLPESVETGDDSQETDNVPVKELEKLSLVTPARSGFGSVGRKVLIKANHFLVGVGNRDPHQYDVTIAPEVTSNTKRRDIMKILSDEYSASHLGNLLLAYDGKKSAFAAGPLPFDSKEFDVKLAEQNGREREFKVTINFAARKELDHLRQFLAGRQHDNPQETIQALDVVLRECASKDREIVGRSLFHTDFGRGPLGDGIEYWKGFYQSLRPTQMGLSLNIDMSARAFYEPKLLTDFVGEFLGADMSRPLSDQERIKVKRALKGVRVEVRRQDYKRRYKVQGLTAQPISQLNFIDDMGATKTVVQYFREKYNVQLRFPALPAVQAGTDAKPTYLPMEICWVTPGQRYALKLNERQVTQFLRATCQRPKDREDSIDNIMKKNKYNKDPLVSKDFEMKVTELLTSIEARVLPPPPAQPETLKTVQTTITKQLSIDETILAPATKFVDLGADSLDTVEIMMALEEQFGVSIGESGAENISKHVFLLGFL